MHRVAFLLVFAAPLAPSTDDGSQILGQIRLKVMEQVKGSANYTCVQTTERQYFEPARYEAFGCDRRETGSKRKEVMHDRLRLDVAVSEGHEIYSWHGGKSFTSGGISELVRSGPISSGSFVGYLENIFLDAGIRFDFLGQASRNGTDSYGFAYSVPLAVSNHEVAGRGRRSPRVPFHGEFFADARTFELTSLQVIVDEVPPEVEICDAEIDMKYGTAKISGRDALIPQVFSLHIDDASHVYTTSTSEYTACREFRGESTLHFEMSEGGEQAGAATAPAPSDRRIPAGVPLHIRLLTPIAENSSFTGDPVQGVLIEPIRLRGKNHEVIPQGAVLNGVITLLEQRNQPSKHILYSIEFDELTSGNRMMQLRAWPKPTREAAMQLAYVYGRIPDWLLEEYRTGLFVTLSSKLRLNNRFSGIWETVSLPAESR